MNRDFLCECCAAMFAVQALVCIPCYRFHSKLSLLVLSCASFAFILPLWSQSSTTTSSSPATPGSAVGDNATKSQLASTITLVTCGAACCSNRAIARSSWRWLTSRPQIGHLSRLSLGTDEAVAKARPEAAPFAPPRAQMRRDEPCTNWVHESRSKHCTCAHALPLTGLWMRRCESGQSSETSCCSTNTSIDSICPRPWRAGAVGCPSPSSIGIAGVGRSHSAVQAQPAASCALAASSAWPPVSGHLLRESGVSRLL